MSDSEIKTFSAFWYAQIWCLSLFYASFWAWLRLSVFHSEQLLLATVFGALASPFLLTAAGMWNLRSHHERKGAALSAFGYFVLANIHFGAYLEFKGFVVSDGTFFFWVGSCFALSAAMDFCLEQTWMPFILLTGMWRTERIRHNALEESMYPWAVVARWRGEQDAFAPEVDVLADKQSLWGDTKWNGGMDKSVV